MTSLRKQIKKAKEEIAKAKAIPCTCSSFALQYNQGCECARGEALKKARTKLSEIIAMVD